MATISIDGVDHEAPSSANTDRWQDAFTPVLEALAERQPGIAGVSVKDYGAAGNGTTDDTQAVRDAISAAESEGSRLVHFPPGSYRIVPTPGPSEDNIEVIRVPSNFSITGEGEASIVLWEGDVDGAEENGELALYKLFACEQTHDVLIRGLSFIGMNDPFVYIQQCQSAAIDAWINCSDITVRDCTFLNFFGFSVHASRGGPSTGGDSLRINVIDCKTENCANGINVNADYSMQIGNVLINSEGFESSGAYTIISDNIINSAWNSAISLGGAGLYAPGMAVYGNDIDGAEGVGIIGGDCFVDGFVSNNYMRHCKLGGILFHETGEVGWSVCTRNTVNGNVIADSGGSGASFGMWITGTGGHIITNNRITIGGDGSDDDEGTFFMNSALLLASPNNIVSNNYLQASSGQIDLVLANRSVGTVVGHNFLGNGSSGMQGDSTIVPIDNIGRTGTDIVETSRLTGDFYPQFQRLLNGAISWGTTALLLDTNLYRSNPDQLKTDDEMVAGIGFAIGAQKIRNAATIPIAGTWLLGDIVFKTDPVSGGFIGWVCTVAGTPGTWKTWGVIS